MSDFTTEAPYKVVLANVLADVLCRHAPRVANYVAADGRLVLSGILTEQYDTVAAAYAREGFTECDRAVIDEWTSGCFRRINQ
jgi:ribosomal protein L11 methyltransferase